MIRKITVSTPHLKIVATLNSRRGLARREVEDARSALADMLMHVASGVRFMPTPISKVKVK